MPMLTACSFGNFSKPRLEGKESIVMENREELEAQVEKEKNWAEHFECEQPVYKSCVMDAKTASCKSVKKLLSKWSKGLSPAVQEYTGSFSDLLKDSLRDLKGIIFDDGRYVVIQTWLNGKPDKPTFKITMGIIKKQAEF